MKRDILAMAAGINLGLVLINVLNEMPWMAAFNLVIAAICFYGASSKSDAA